MKPSEQITGTCGASAWPDVTGQDWCGEYCRPEKTDWFEQIERDKQNG